MLTFCSYYEHLQSSIPLFPENKDELLARLTASQCQSLPEGFLQAVECVNSMLIPQLALQNQQASESLEANARASLQRADWELEMGSNGSNMSIALSDQLLYIVAMLLIVIYQDMRPDSYGSRTAKVDYLGRSVARLALLKENDAVRHDGDNTFALFSRVSGILFIIDRYNAIGNFGEYLLPLDCSEMLSQYSLVVNEEMYELARKEPRFLIARCSFFILTIQRCCGASCLHWQRFERTSSYGPRERGLKLPLDHIGIAAHTGALQKQP